MASKSQHRTGLLYDHGITMSAHDLQRRRRLSVRQHNSPQLDPHLADANSQPAHLHEHNHEGSRSRHALGSREDDDKAEEKDASISISSTSKQAGKMVQPFLTEHIPQAYNPLGGDSPPATAADKSSTKYCYRHRPDLLCRRQADEPSMDQLQQELGSLSQSDQQGIAHVWSLFSAAPSKHRQLMLQGILTQCCFPQLSFVSASVRDLIKIDFLAALPNELGFQILGYLDTISLCKAAQVNRRWRTLADDDVVWHKMCEQHIDRKCTQCGWGLPLLEQKRLRMDKRRIQLRLQGRPVEDTSPAITAVSDHAAPEPVPEPNGITSLNGSLGKKRSAEAGLSALDHAAKRPRSNGVEMKEQPAKRPWKDVYKDRFKVGTNWKYGRCSIKSFQGHTNGVMCLQFDDNFLATGSYDNTIKIWDMESGEEVQTLRGHTAGIRCLQLNGERLISGSLDRSIKVWNWRTGELIRTLLGPLGGIISLHCSDNWLAAGSMDRTIRVWCLSSKLGFLLKGHTDWVNSVKVDAESKTLFSASDDCTVKLWDLTTQCCLKTFTGHVGQVQQVLPLPREFELNEKELHDAQEAEQSADEGQEEVLPGDNYGHRALGLHRIRYRTPNGTQQSGSKHSLRSHDPLFPDEPDRPLPPDFMLTAALDGTIRLWHVPSGKCIRTFFGHVEGIWAIAADTLRLVSGAEDRMVKVWDPRTGSCERTFTGHVGPVTCVGLSDCRMATGSEDCEVRVYSFEEEGLRDASQNTP